MSDKKIRRTLEDVEEYYPPESILSTIQESQGWPYAVDREQLQLRDRALVCLIYLCALRISEALRLTKSQFRIEEDKQRVRIVAIQLSKRRELSKVKFREAWLPLPAAGLETARQNMTQIVLDYLNTLEGDAVLFPFKRARAWQIITATSNKYWCHLFRALGENFLYDAWDHDMLAVADYVKVSPRTLEKYIRRGYEKYKPV